MLSLRSVPTAQPLGRRPRRVLAAALVAAAVLTAGGVAASLAQREAPGEPTRTSRSASLVAVRGGVAGWELSAGLTAPHALVTP
jgi:hypothetical protein